jgi:hypothetical protein
MRLISRSWFATALSLPSSGRWLRLLCPSRFSVAGDSLLLEGGVTEILHRTFG